jgi:arabinan endo-1,5-alpha-L-arabinosidase
VGIGTPWKKTTSSILRQILDIGGASVEIHISITSTQDGGLGMSWKTLFCSVALSVAAIFAGAAGAITLTGNINSHDPAGLIKDGGTYYHFTTGTGVWYSYSTNLTQWTPGPATVFPSGQWPAWINTAVPGFAGQFWAPDAIYMNGYYYLYYSASTFGSSRSAIGVTRTASLASPNWQDQGVVVQSNGSSNVINAIDAALFTDTNGNVYMSYGSWFGGIAVVQINQSTGKIVNGATPTKIAGGNGADWEAPYIVKEGSYYYLFVNRGNCCQGANSTYRIVVGRATSITGPYLNQSGGNLNSTDGTTVLATSGKYIGPGHFGLLREGSCNYVSTHYYDGNDNGNAKLDILSLTFSNGWPTLTRNFTVGTCATGNSLNVSTSSVSLSSGAGNSPVTVTANISWSATDNQSWLTVAPSTGSGNGSISISASANTGAARSGTVTVSGGGISRTIAVSQASGTSSSLTLSPSSLAFGIEPQLVCHRQSVVAHRVASQRIEQRQSLGHRCCKYGRRPQRPRDGHWRFHLPNDQCDAERSRRLGPDRQRYLQVDQQELEPVLGFLGLQRQRRRGRSSGRLQQLQLPEMGYQQRQQRHVSHQEPHHRQQRGDHRLRRVYGCSTAARGLLGSGMRAIHVHTDRRRGRQLLHRPRQRR